MDLYSVWIKYFLVFREYILGYDLRNLLYIICFICLV